MSDDLTITGYATRIGDTQMFYYQSGMDGSITLLTAEGAELSTIAARDLPEMLKWLREMVT